MQLTQAQCKLIAPGQTLWDSEVTGLHLVRGRRGASWKLAYRTQDRIRRCPKLGSFPALGLAQARDAARELLRQVATGADPSAQWQALRAAPTMADLCARYQSEWLPRKSPSSALQDRYRIANVILPAIGSLRVADVSTGDVQAVLEAVLHRRGRQPRSGYVTAPVSANRCRALLWKLFTLAEQWGLRSKGTNPMPDTEHHIERKRRRHATAEEFPRLAAALNKWAVLYPRQIAAIRVIMLTGARVKEITEARVHNRQGSELVFAPHEHKTGKRIGEKRIKLPAEALAIMDHIAPTADGFIFGRDVLRDVWDRVRLDAGCPDLQLRDARRTFASAAKSAGASLDQIAEVFGHTSTATTSGYAWLFDETQTALVDGTAAEIARKLGG